MLANSSVSVESPPKYDVFLNFRGEQLRRNFVSHLEKALKIDGINVYMDKIETKGNDLSMLFTRIEQSSIAITIFSTQYTQSRWCLDELDKINQCVKSGKLVVIPIFYKVDTNDVKNMDGVFGEEFWKLAKARESESEKYKNWRDAINAVSGKVGFTLGEKDDEGEFIDQIVGDVRKQLTNISIHRADEGVRPEAASDSPSSLFGIKTRLKQLEEKLDFKCEDTLTIGVVGMPGIGKTTLMNVLYDKLQEEFLRCVFIRDVRNINFKRDGNILKKELLRVDGLDQQVDNMSDESLKALLLSKQFIVILDNVSDKKQIEVLLGRRDWIKRGSRIFITTSDRSVIEGMVDDTYVVQRLSGRDSYDYFRRFAFRGKLQEGNFMDHSRLFVDYAEGNPSVLMILGNDLNGQEKTSWEKKHEALKQSPNEMIRIFLRKSYDELCQLQKDVFLDVACFFRSGDEYYVRCLVESSDTEPIDAVSKIKDLASKFLLNIYGGRVEMHDILYAFGKELGSEDSCRLWDHQGVVDALKNRAGAASVRGIFLDMSKLKKKLPLDSTTFVKMTNLRYLKFYSCCHLKCQADCKFNFPEGLDFPMDELRYLYWLKFPLKRLPKDFNPKNLTDLNLPYSEIEEVWEGLKDTPKLKWVDLSHSRKLGNLSGFLNAESLQRLNLEGCTSLEALPDEMKHMKSLVFLNMRGCEKLRGLPHMNLISMKTLILTNCSSLEEFQVISTNLETLHLDGTKIGQLPEDMVKLQKLIVLNLKDCKELRAVPEFLGKLKALQELVLSGCSGLKTFPVPVENMKCLHILLLDGTEIKEISKIFQCSNSTVEDLCELRRGMNGLSSLRRLCLSRNEKIRNLQLDINQLYHLKRLDLKYCKNLTSISSLPLNLEILDAHGCDKLKTIALPIALLKLMEQVQSKFIFTNCNNLAQVAKSSITAYALRKLQLDALRCDKEGIVSKALLITCYPGSEVPSWFRYQSFGSELKLKFPPHWFDNRLSTLVLCAVVKFPPDEINRFSIECTCELNKLGTCIRFSCTLDGGWIEPRKIDSDHVFIGYSHMTKHLEGSLKSQEHLEGSLKLQEHLEGSLKSQEHHKYDTTEVSIKFKVRNGAGEIVNCGLSLVYEEQDHVVVEGNRNETKRRRLS